MKNLRIYTLNVHIKHTAVLTVFNVLLCYIPSTY